MPGRFTVKILIDKQEGNNSVHDFDWRKREIEAKLKQENVCEKRTLKAGDYIFVARDERTGMECVLDYLIERKSHYDYGRCTQEKSKEYKGLMRIQVQMHNMIASNIQNKLLLLEGPVQEGEESMSCQAKEMAEAHGFDFVETRNKEETIQRLVATYHEAVSIFNSKPILSFFTLNEVEKQIARQEPLLKEMASNSKAKLTMAARMEQLCDICGRRIHRGDRTVHAGGTWKHFKCHCLQLREGLVVSAPPGITPSQNPSRSSTQQPPRRTPIYRPHGNSNRRNGSTQLGSGRHCETAGRRPSTSRNDSNKRRRYNKDRPKPAI